ncbi:MAG: hypothetical protein HGB08_03960 [Candidatus Moranbacteria bacterium]|nr:hypothetical protein [Candidatus Moranbacteria bacterium]
MEPIKSNLEPIDESDLDLKDKFLPGAAAKKENIDFPSEAVLDAETPSLPETNAERKEGAAEKEAAYSKILSKVPSDAPQASSTSNVSSDAKEMSEMKDYESRLEKLVSIAESKGVVHAVKVARHMEDNYLLDELHDRLLSADLHDALVRKGLITEI